jgi:Chaperone of endosialidase
LAIGQVLISTGASNTAYAATAVTISNGPAYDQLNAGSFYQTSLRETKTNIEVYNGDALEIISRTTVVSFAYKTSPDVIHYGFIADDTPVELSTIEKNRMDTNSSIGILIKAVQELEDRIKKLENN